uniref:Uncharacterized protein n=1 Tax=Anopheles epiroticus TaxID=199890 RepID=A0A182PQR7_9DIPT
MELKKHLEHLSYGWQQTLTANTSPSCCYELVNGHGYLEPGASVDPNQDYLAYAVLSPTRTSATIWKLINAYPSCFHLCNVRTGEYLMVAPNDAVYSVNKTQLRSYAPSAFIFGVSYPAWPSRSARITNMRKLQALCASSKLELISQKKQIVTVPAQPGPEATYGVACEWHLVQQASCPTDDRC